MSRKRKHAASQHRGPEIAKAQAPHQAPPAPSAAAALTPDAPYESWPALVDHGLEPVRLPYDEGRVPLPLILLYGVFTTFAVVYGVRWLWPDYLRYFGP